MQSVHENSKNSRVKVRGPLAKTKERKQTKHSHLSNVPKKLFDLLSRTIDVDEPSTNRYAGLKSKRWEIYRETDRVKASFFFFHRFQSEAGTFFSENKKKKKRGHRERCAGRKTIWERNYASNKSVGRIRAIFSVCFRFWHWTTTRGVNPFVVLQYLWKFVIFLFFLFFFFYLSHTRYRFICIT